MKKLKIISFGAGAIGSYIGGTLALAEHDVSFVERLECPVCVRIMVDM